MTSCTCGHVQDAGRFCANCGADLVDVTRHAERVSADPDRDGDMGSRAGETVARRDPWVAGPQGQAAPPPGSARLGSPEPGAPQPGAGPGSGQGSAQGPPAGWVPAGRSGPGGGWVPPPVTNEGGSNARFPLYADEATIVGGQPPVGPPPAGPPPSGPPAGPPPASGGLLSELPSSEPEPPRRRRTLLVGILAILVIAVAAGIGTYLIVRDPDSGGSSSPSAADDSTDGASDPGESGSPSPDDTDEPTETRSPSGPPKQVAADADVSVPATAPAGVDVSGNRVSFDADQMLDGDPETTWRMEGDGTGASLTLTLPEDTQLTEVGLINGYAKLADDGGKKIDWYLSNRRIDEVTWIFDDGTEVNQQLGETKQLQTMGVDATTRTVELRLDTVGAPGKGPNGRDFTAISELSLKGSPLS